MHLHLQWIANHCDPKIGTRMRLHKNLKKICTCHSRDDWHLSPLLYHYATAPEKCILVPICADRIILRLVKDFILTEQGTRQLLIINHFYAGILPNTSKRKIEATLYCSLHFTYSYIWWHRHIVAHVYIHLEWKCTLIRENSTTTIYFVSHINICVYKPLSIVYKTYICEVCIIFVCVRTILLLNSLVKFSFFLAKIAT